MGAGAAMAGATVLGAAGNYFGAKESADARKDAAKIANAPFRMKRPFLQDLYERGQEASGVPDYQGLATGENAPRPFQQGFQQTQDLASQLVQSGYGQGVSQYGQDLLSGQYLDPSSNEALQQRMDAVSQQVNETLQRDILPGIGTDAVGAGQYGSSRQGVLEANAVDDTTQNLSNELARMQLEAYEQERQRQMQAPGMIQQGTEMQLTPAQLQTQTGQQMLQLGQQLDPMQRLRQYGQLLGVGPNQQVSPQPGPMPTQSAISGALGGASTAAGIYQAFQQAGARRGGTQQYSYPTATKTPVAQG